jgi:hypothetical protein
METNSPVVNIEIKPGGPILIKSTITIKHVDGAEETSKDADILWGTVESEDIQE